LAAWRDVKPLANAQRGQSLNVVQGASMKYLISLCLFLVFFTGCKTEELDPKTGAPYKGLDKDLVFDDDGRFLAIATRLIPPHTLIVNGDKPTEREVRLLGVEGLSESKAPNTYKAAQEWMYKFLTHGETLYIKPGVGTDKDQKMLFGEVYMEAVDPVTNEPLPNKYVMVNMAMLSQGLVKIRDVREFTNPLIQDKMKQVEDEARREKRGLWSDRP
jgi:endonuclease YncB( thermonuclease family)